MAERCRDRVRAEDIVRFVRVAQATLGVAKVRLTGGEPLARADLVDIVTALSELGVSDLALTTNGQELARLARPLRDAGLQRINVSLDSLDATSFTRMARGGDLGCTLDGIAAATEAGLAPIRINTVVMRGINDHEAEELIAYAFDLGCEPRFIELMPSGLAPEDYHRWYVPSSELRERLARRCDLSPEPHTPGASSRRFRAHVNGRSGVVGFISPNSHPFCTGCRRLRLTSDGRLLGCLGRREHVGLLALLRSTDRQADQHLGAAMRDALGRKRSVGAFAVAMPMSTVGG
jgi:cyclic pyranopterin phosphate synthase